MPLPDPESPLDELPPDDPPLWSEPPLEDPPLWLDPPVWVDPPEWLELPLEELPPELEPDELEPESEADELPPELESESELGLDKVLLFVKLIEELFPSFVVLSESVFMFVA